MVEYDLIGLLVEKCEKFKFKDKFESGLYASMYRSILAIKNPTENFNSMQPTRKCILDFWAYEGKVMHLLYIIDFFHKHAKYFFRREIMNKSVICYSFDSTDYFIKECNDIVTLMLQINQKIPMKKDVSDSIKRAYGIIDTFEKHGHYLPNLSGNNDEHQIRDVFLYLKFVHTCGVKIYNLAVGPVERNIAYKYITPSEEKEERPWITSENIT